MILFDKEIPIFFQDINISEENFIEILFLILQDFDFDSSFIEEELEEDSDRVVSFVKNTLYSFDGELTENISEKDIESLLNYVLRLTNDDIEEIIEQF